ncbi:peptidyl-prolyl cis-trans isomerase [Paenibacillus alginolyticus]|uniref:peptidylprolyl isomerase n=1 Tax=Paenibacillus alginolyticus TaxID=59839 RepID=A0ABT4GMZ2_9BACL|nr:peptidyl-prolyl cis-trans isomerase [Paenibacillus alginolyticus]MCY9697595.1 peptidyl-prolyl cis-trans isomerase [Paenibacillus alginolyticus]MEC0141809.1 peptidyl-prolyl cis-trans isomerase [Paenibacillus alginolyticus]
MQNVKRLWGVIIVMAVGNLVLASLLVTHTINQSEPSQSPKPEKQGEQKNDRVVAKIGDREMTILELQTALEHHYGAELLGQMLDREVIRLEGNETGTSIGSAEINRELKRMQQGYESEQQFYASMKSQLGLSEQEIKEDVTNKLLLEKLATKHIQITDAQVEDYMKAHADEFKQITEYNILQIIVSTKDQANKVLAELAKGESFATLARDRSLDDATNNTGGDLGWIEGDDPFVAAPVLETAKLLKVGEVSKPVPLPQGFAIVKLKNRREKVNPDLAFVRENVRRELALHEAPPLKDYVKQLREKWKVSILDPQFR